MIRLNGVTKRFQNGERVLTVLEEVTCDVRAGESVAVAGPSGSGKTTLLGLMAGLDRPTAGSITVDGVELTRLSVDEAARLRGARMGFVFQAFHLIPTLSALENVMIPLELARNPRAESLAREALIRVGLGERLTHRPALLSGGEAQRVALARAVAPRPAILFADEPTGNLDRTTGAQIADLLFELVREGKTTLVLVTHDPGLAARADRVLSLVGGRLDAGRPAPSRS